jgi:hypothetical protein
MKNKCVIKIPFKCPYNEFSCPHVDTLSSTLDASCDQCQHYNNGVRSTGAIPMLEQMFKFLKNKIWKK